MHEVKFIAEISSNHNRDLKRSIEFIKQAATVGCDGVKFQLFRIDQLFAPEILQKSQRHRERRQWELPTDFIPELADACHELGILFSCTPFYLDAVAELEREAATSRGIVEPEQKELFAAPESTHKNTVVNQ